MADLNVYERKSSSISRDVDGMGHCKAPALLGYLSGCLCGAYNALRLWAERNGGALQCFLDVDAFRSSWSGLSVGWMS